MLHEHLSQASNRACGLDEVPKQNLLINDCDAMFDLHISIAGNYANT